MLNHCRASCHSCDSASNFTGWRFNVTGPHMLSNGVGDDAVCLDTRGQLPGGHGGSNMLHTLPCDPTAPSQRWRFNGTGGAIQAMGSPDAAASNAAPCLRVWSVWLWAVPLVDTANCDAPHPRANEQWTLTPNGTLRNGQYGCVEVSRDSGPPTTIWTKPLEGGQVALLAINGADETQTISLDFAELLESGSQAWEARDVWMGVDLGRRTAVSRNVQPHDCILLILSPARMELLPA